MVDPHTLLRRDQIVVNHHRIRQAGDILEQIQRTSSTALNTRAQKRLQLARSLVEDVFHELTASLNEVNSEVLHRPPSLLPGVMSVHVATGR